VAVAAAAGYGLIAGWWTPRGPVTVVEALSAMLLGLVVGVVAGAALTSRWSMLLAPVVFTATFEVVRWGATGPTVDGIHPGSVYGFIALVAGRGFHGLLTLTPMILGAALGAGWARHRAAQPGRRGRLFRAGVAGRRVVAAAVGVGLLVLAGLVVRPASTAAISGPDGQPLAGGVAELTRVAVGGHDLSLMIRGNDVTNPVLLFLAGGPGGSELGAMRRYGQELEKDFVVVTLDQRGTGASYDQIEPMSTMTVQSAVDDVAGVTGYLKQRFGAEKVYLLGQSWGTTLGVLAVQAQPQSYAAFVGVGQMVSLAETDRILYDDTLAWARSTGRTGLVGKLQANGPPPYQDLLAYPAMFGYEQEVYAYDHSANAEGAGQMAESLPAGEYSLLQTVNLARGLLDTFAVLYPQLQGIDFRADAPRLDVPVYLVEGRYEPRARADLARQWFAMLDAPSKQWVEFDTSGHRPLFEQPDLFAQVMTGTVLAQTQGRS
jgi:pimeloyl-ACP methyl ester carboxylesterase